MKTAEIDYIAPFDSDNNGVSEKQHAIVSINNV